MTLRKLIVLTSLITIFCFFTLSTQVLAGFEPTAEQESPTVNPDLMILSFIDTNFDEEAMRFALYAKFLVTKVRFADTVSLDELQIFLIDSFANMSFVTFEEQRLLMEEAILMLPPLPEQQSVRLYLSLQGLADGSLELKMPIAKSYDSYNAHAEDGDGEWFETFMMKVFTQASGSEQLDLIDEIDKPEEELPY